MPARKKNGRVLENVIARGYSFNETLSLKASVMGGWAYLQLFLTTEKEY